MINKELVAKICRHILKENPDWVGGEYDCLAYPHHEHNGDFLYAVLLELKHKGATREDLESGYLLAQAKETCIPKPRKQQGFGLRTTFNRDKKMLEITNMIVGFLDELFPEKVLEVDHSAVKAPVRIIKQREVITKSSVAKEVRRVDLPDMTLSAEERYANYLAKISAEDKDPSLGNSPIVFFNSDYTYDNLIEDKPELFEEKTELKTKKAKHE